jgi:MtN3 and saliva related transmembrane protein
MAIDPEIFGGIAAALTTLAYIPQTIKVVRDKDTKSISLGMYSMMTAGIACWLIYGILLESPSLMIANGATLVMAIIILIMKIKHG